MELSKDFKSYNEIFEFDDFNQNPFMIEKKIADTFRNKSFHFIHNHHYLNNSTYKTYCDILFQNEDNINNDFVVSARSFKDTQLYSVGEDEIFKILTSSGTSGSIPSSIYLDKQTAKAQSKVLAYLLKSFMNTPRVPMLVIDSQSTLKDRKSFNARGAGIIGFSIMANKITYALDDNLNVDYDIVNDFLEKNGANQFLIFGFTFLVYQALIQNINPKYVNNNIFKNAILFHGGGWKKLAHLGVSNEEFKNSLSNLYGLNKIHNYYGMVEQTGSIYIECDKGYFHNSIYSDIEIVDSSLKKLEFGQKGLIKLKSVLPFSYPGHSLLTEDIGICFGEDDCKCGLKGKYFHVLGRAEKAEIRGCSDVK